MRIGQTCSKHLVILSTVCSIQFSRTSLRYPRSTVDCFKMSETRSVGPFSEIFLASARCRQLDIKAKDPNLHVCKATAPCTESVFHLCYTSAAETVRAKKGVMARSCSGRWNAGFSVSMCSFGRISAADSSGTQWLQSKDDTLYKISATLEGTRPLYAVLAVPPDATSEEIKQAYRRLALQHHPDKCQGADVAEAEALFARIALAYEILGNEQRRRRYDLTGELPQNDAAAGRSAQDTFLAEYMKAAPRTARAATQADYSLHSLDNYEILEVDGKDVPAYMHGIVSRGLGYLAAVLEGMEEMEVVLLRHFVMDQMYALLAYTPPLDANAFSDRGYVITYYDAPLQAGIQPSWSDQNGPSGRSGKAGASLSELRVIDGETAERRRLAALEWVAPSAPSKNVEQPKVPGSGLSEERLRVAAKMLARLLTSKNGDISGINQSSFTGARLRKELEEMLGLEAGGLKSFGSSQLMGIVLSACDEVEEEGEVGISEEGAGQQAAGPIGPSSAQEDQVHATALSPEPCCSGIPFWRRFLDEARDLLRGRL
eukprot:s441_g26.t1